MSIELNKVHVPIAEVQKYADIGSVRDELLIAKKLCEIAILDREDNYQNTLLVDGLITAAIIRYVRCFHTTGKRYGLKAENVPEDLMDEHNYFRNIRDKHVAHSVNAFEQPYVSTYIEIENGQRKPFTRLLPESERVIFNVNNAKALNILIEVVLDGVLAEMTLLHDEALAIVNSLDECAIKKLKPWNSLEIDFEKVNRGR